MQILFASLEDDDGKRAQIILASFFLLLLTACHTIFSAKESTTMQDILKELEASIADEYFSRSEKKSIRSLVRQSQPTEHELSVLRSKVFDMAQERINADNFSFIMQWTENALKALIVTSTEQADEVYFSPGESCRTTIINLIRSATRTLDICVFTISDNPISKAIIEAHQKGIAVKILTDDDKSEDRGSDIAWFHREGLSIKVDETSDHMHHKFMVVDGKVAMTGSYNWTRSAAEYNFENLLVTRDPAVVKSFLKEFDRLWRKMVDY